MSGKRDGTARGRTFCTGWQYCICGESIFRHDASESGVLEILRNELRVSGTWNSSFTGSEDDDWHYVVRALAEGRVYPEKLITHRLPMEQLMQGLTIMRDKTEDYVKIMGVNE